MNIKVTAYNEKGTLFNFDFVTRNLDDFKKVIKVLETFYNIYLEGEK